MNADCIKTVVYHLALTCLFTGTIDAQASEPDIAGQLALVSLRFELTDGDPIVEIEEFIVVETSKRVNEVLTLAREAGYALILADTRSLPMDTIYIADPLNPVYEYSEDEETIQSVSLPQHEGHVLIRFPYVEEMSQIRIAKCTENQQLSIIHSIAFPEAKE